MAMRTAKRRGLTVSRDASISPPNLQAGHRTLNRSNSSKAALAPSPRHRRARLWRAPRAAIRLWRFWSWRLNFCGDDDATAYSFAPRTSARFRDAVRLGAFTEGRAG